MTKLEELALQTQKIDRMHNTEKGQLLLECVRNQAMHAGTDENELIALLAHHGGIFEGIYSATVQFSTEHKKLN